MDFDLSADLSSTLRIWRRDHAQQFAPPANAEEESLFAAMDAVETFVLDAVATGQISPELNTRLETYRPGDDAVAKLQPLLGYEDIHTRLAFSVAE
jgi:hypothetical protein